MSEQDQAMTEIKVKFADGLEETRYVPGVVGDCVKLEIAWRPEPVVFELDGLGEVYVESVDGECKDEPARPSSNRKR
jgi:hypothetical protein